MKKAPNQKKMAAGNKPLPTPTLKKEQALQDTFFQYLFSKPQLIELACITAGLVVMHVLLFTWYPTSFTFSDTKNYLLAALNRSFMGYRPYGYSAFLVFVQGFSPTNYAAYFFQFLLYGVSSIFFVFTIKYIFRPASKVLSYGFSFFVVFSPASLFMTNYLLSDSIFASLTVLWITSTIWIFYRQRYLAVILHFVLLFMLIHVRYSGMFYLIVSVGVMLFVFGKKKQVWVAAGLSMIPVLLGWHIYSNTKKNMNRIVSLNVFSGFTGWQLANNAMHIIPYIDLKPEDISNPKVRSVHEYALALPDSVYIRNGLSSAYIWEREYPLKQYLLKQIYENKRFYLRAWVHAGITFEEYGKLLIRKYPVEFFNHFILPNTKEAIYPRDAGAIGSYGILTSDNRWFVQDSTDYVQPTNDVAKNVYAPMLPILTLLQWITVFAALLVSIVFRKHLLFDPAKRVIYRGLLLFGAAYMAFGIYAAPFEVRYLLPIHALQVAVVYMVLMSKRKPQEPATHIS